MSKKKLTYKAKKIDIFKPIGVVVAYIIAAMTFSSCVNNHCNEDMYTPLNLAFFSEIDTAQQVTPLFLTFQGIGVDSVLYASGTTNINLPLNSESNEVNYEVLMTFSASTQTVLVADSTQPFFSVKRQNSYGMTLTDSIPTCYYSLDGTKYYRLLTGSDYLFYFEEGNPLVLLTKDDPYVYFQNPTKDTLNIKYNKSLEFVSAECGCKNTYEITQASFKRGGVASIQINNPNVNSESNAKHINLYLENY